MVRMFCKGVELGTGGGDIVPLLLVRARMVDEEASIEGETETEADGDDVEALVLDSTRDISEDEGRVSCRRDSETILAVSSAELRAAALAFSNWSRTTETSLKASSANITVNFEQEIQRDRMSIPLSSSRNRCISSSMDALSCSSCSRRIFSSKALEYFPSKSSSEETTALGKQSIKKAIN